MNAIWFSRHDPTPEELVDIEGGFYYTLVGIEEGKELGSRVITSKTEALRVAREIRALAEKYNARAVFGVWSVDFQHLFNTHFRERHALPCMGAAMNLMNPMGEKSFVHREWLRVGYLGWKD